MSVNLHLVLATAPDYAAQWAGLCRFGSDAIVPMDDDAVTAAARLLDNAPLSNGSRVFAYVDEDAGEEWSQGSYVGEFAPCALEAGTLAKLRDLVARFPQALAMLDHVVEKRLSIILNPTVGWIKAGAHMTGTHGTPDNVEVNRCKGNMQDLVQDLRLDMDEFVHVPFDRFETAYRGAADRLRHKDLIQLAAFVKSGHAQGATAVYWG